jgi:prepilin-type N-terminal cleavage/methylation domain-containing protein
MAAKRGFTLIELLIVVTVFVITFALLTPFVNKMRDRADMIKCSANVRLLSLGLHMYAADHNDAFPPDLGSLYPDYIKEEKVFDCPASKFIGTAAKSDYEYISGLSESSVPSEVIIYDREGNHNNLGRNVVRVNGSVEWVHSTEGKPR